MAQANDQREEAATGGQAPAPLGNVAAVMAVLFSLAAAGLAYAHLFIAAVKVDAVGLSLFAAIFLPWILPFVKSFKFGGAEVQMRDLQRQVQEAKKLAKQAEETAEDTREAVSEPAVAPESAVDAADAKPEEIDVLRAISQSAYAFRTPSGIASDLKKPDVAEVSTLLKSLEGKGVVRRATSRRGDDLWTLVKSPPS
ncbi:hypothetical protein RGUI_2156 [Rhodovulum sp. P5]|uniref:hypothetical protein n=1 Tax=Rhodovulum sp. P5 TaxID=1564506 RepID=UPI0009C1FC99|nr:hypothetical protein [Rhodovulum sp. P5]ARE40297.1 hypothetical protein RGUI_2156 [Rhodovulum sp. P5]